jgi:superfamily II DNA or RNA helicase
MLGLSATPYRRDNLSKLIFWYMGDIHHEVSRNRLLADGHVLPAAVIQRFTRFQTRFDPVNEYTKMLTELAANDARNHLIASDVAKAASEGDGVCLVLSDRKQHCETLQSILKYRHKTACDLLTGDLNDTERNAVIEKLNQNRLRVLIATGQLVGEGFDCSGLSILFLATPISFSGRLLQYLGRVLRPAPGKSVALVYDYVDARIDVLRKAAEKRRAVYLAHADAGTESTLQ